MSFLIFFVGLISFTDSLNSEETYVKEMQINSSTKFDSRTSEFPTNPFEIVDMIRRINSLNDATKPSDAIDNALESFNITDEKEKL